MLDDQGIYLETIPGGQEEKRSSQFSSCMGIWHAVMIIISIKHWCSVCKINLTPDISFGERERSPQKNLGSCAIQ